MMRSRLRNQEGWAVVTAVSLLGIMLTLGLATYALVDNNTVQSRIQRERESALNLTEGVLYAQGYVLARHWPGLSSAPYPAKCTPADSAVPQCPNKDSLSAANSSTPNAAAFNAVDFQADGTWVTSVRDNYGALAAAYDTTLADSQLTGAKGACPRTPCTLDFNDDKALWVQAMSVVRKRARNVVALLKLEELGENVPKAAVSAGAIAVTNSNNSGRPTINGTGSRVVVRCDPNTSGCATYRTSKDGTADVTPQPTGDTGYPRLMNNDQLQRFLERAKIDGRYYSGCPTKGADGQYDLSGAVVWIEGCSTPPSLSNSLKTVPCSPLGPDGMSQSCINQITKPGVLIWHCGRADFQGGVTYVGMIYVVNNSDGTCKTPAPTNVIGNGTCTGSAVNENDAVNLNGGFGIWGVIAVDGPGCLKAGSNGVQITFDARIFGSIKSYGAVGLVQNTWRELPVR